jgi:SAM-dependent methyltransferase
MPPSDQALRNREHWDNESDEYQAVHGPQLNVDDLIWGAWSIPESEVGALGEVAGKDILELGCGAARWSIELAKRGARPVALDNSSRQLEHARGLMAEAGVDFPLFHASAEEIPLPDESFDIVFSDHGALSWADPRVVVPEVARVLRSGALLAANVSSPFLDICYDEENDRVDTRLHRSYFRLDTAPEGNGAATYELNDGDWIRLLRANGFAIEALIELRPPEGGTTTYGGYVTYEWARQWAAEHLWVARKA